MKIEKDKYYIVRSVKAGVYFGHIEEQNGQEVTMTECRCLWYWSGAASLNQMANTGVKQPNNCKFSVMVDNLTLFGVDEILPCTQEAVDCIKGVKEWKV